MKNTFFLLLFFLFSFSSFAQIQGTVRNKMGEPLAFASIYIQGTTQGTTTNVEGDYFFELSNGVYPIVFQYVGYQQKIESVKLDGKVVQLDVVLEAESIDLTEVVVKADAEDPAYAIIRKAIAKRDYYHRQVEEYSCDVYIKGNQKVLDAPEKFLGMEIGDMGGSLDSNRQGILYLSESQAKLFRRQPDQIKENMISTKVSGNDSGFGFNRASLMDFNFYNSHVEIERELLSPIANTAMQYYRYQLMGTLYDKEGRLINKIKVIPKREYDAVFRGYIYIVEDLWNIQSTELFVTGASIKEPALDTLVITQIHVPVKAPDVWMLLSQSLDFKFGAFGFQVKGNFTGIFSNYNLSPNLGKGFFTNEIFKVDEGANEKDSSYWESARPIPLTVEEERDYVKKDSLQVIWKSKTYLDSMDRKNNRFELWDLLIGYDWDNSYKKQSLSIEAPLATVQFNPVQGFYGNLNLRYRKKFDDYLMRWYSIGTKLQYGFSDKRFRGQVEFTYNLNRTRFTQVRLTGGSVTAQFNGENPVSSFLDTNSSLLLKKNFIRLYQKDFARFHFRQEIVNGIYLRSSLEFARRTALQNTTNYSYFTKSKTYASNDEGTLLEGGLAFNEDKALILDVSLRFRINQKYLSYPKRKYIQGSEWPEFWLHYKKGLAISAFDTATDFDKLTVNIKDKIQLGLLGFSSFNLEAGTFLRKQNLSVIDFQHFNGNRMIFARPSDYYTSFLLLPYYSNSTPSSWLQGHYEHHFEGFIMDKLPLLRKLNIKSVFSASFLYTKENKDYLELSFGFENIGFGVLRIFRFDIVNSFSRGKYLETGFVIGVDL